jgi:glycosyltransferase involved in cell wall biosynthesis
VERENYPLVTVGIITFNREWSIEAVLQALRRQTYPHEKIFVLIVDGGSKDKTVEKAKAILQSSDFYGYKVIVEKSNIPEARNICIENMYGELLFFLDSDVLIEPRALEKLVGALQTCRCEILSANCRSIVVKDTGKIWSLLLELDETQQEIKEVVEVPSAAMGHTLIKKEVFEKVRFDNSLNFGEDADFCINAREKGFHLCLHKGATAFDVNVGAGKLSDIYVYSPIMPQIRSLKKRAKAKTFGLGFRVTPIDVAKYFLQNKRYVFYLSYSITIPLFILGLGVGNIYLASLFPLELFLYISLQAKRRDLRGALRATLLSLFVGLPLSLLMLAYSVKGMSQEKPFYQYKPIQCRPT